MIDSRARQTGPVDRYKVGPQAAESLPHRRHRPLLFQKSPGIDDFFIETQWNTLAKTRYLGRIVIKAGGKEYAVTFDRDELSGFLDKEG